jgi:hypothetical protein
MTQMPPMPQMPPTVPGSTASREVPGATAAMVLGIISIVMNVPVVALILSLIGLSKARAAKALCDAHPGYYTNAGIAQAGMVLCIIGICLGSLSTLCGCGYFAMIALALLSGAGAGAGAGP